MVASLTYADWLMRLSFHQFGRMWLSKFKYDLNNGNMPADVEHTLKRKVEEKLKTSEPDFPALAILGSVILENPASFDLKGLRIPPNLPPHSLIVKLEDFAYYYLRRRVLVTILDESDDELDFIWENISDIISPRFFTGMIRTERAFFWCTPTDEINNIVLRSKPNRAATKLRNRLGLHRVAKGQRLVRMDIPPDSLLGKTLCAPTTLDSGVNPTFVPFNSADGYGRTLNLKTIRRDTKEIIAEEIPFDKSFTATSVGKVGARVPSISWTDIEALVK